MIYDSSSLWKKKAVSPVKALLHVSQCFTLRKVLPLCYLHLNNYRAKMLLNIVKKFS